MEKPYDEIFLSDSYLSQYDGLIRDNAQLDEWLKFKLEVDEVETEYHYYLMGWTVKYKRNQLQYG